MSTKKILDEKQLQEELKTCKAPKPTNKAKIKALSMAMDSFDTAQIEETIKSENNSKNFKGFMNNERLKGNSGIKTRKNKPLNIWRRVMKKQFKLSGTTSAVAACALLILIGGPLILNNYNKPINSDANTTHMVGTQINDLTYGDEISTIESADKIFIKEATEASPATAPVKTMLIEKELGAMVEVKQRLKIESFAKTNSSNIDNIAPQYKDIGKDKFNSFDDNSIKTVAAEPVSTFSIDVDTASYAFMRKMINSGTLPQKNAVRVEELINYFNYDYPVPENKAQPFQPTVAVYDSPWKTGNKIIHIGIKGYDIINTEKPQSNLVFLLDTSGSMNNSNKLPLLINSMKMLVETLNPDDTIGIVTYAGSAGTVLEPTKASDKHKIITALENLRSGGSTAGAAGIRQAYNLINQNFNKDAVNRVILATDGDFNVGITNHQELQDFIERKRKTGVSLSVLGFGQGNYNDSLMQTLAQNGNGNAAYIDTLNEARKVLVDEASSTLFTIAKDVKFQIEFNPKMVSEYRLIGYETRALNREDFNNDAIDAGEIGAGHSVTAIYEITPINATQNRLIDPLRYSDLKKKMVITKEKQTEYAFLKMRYKLPNEDKSKLLTRSITISDEGDFKAMSNDVRFAASVAAFGQKLRGGKFIDGMTYDNIIKIANEAKGSDNFGYRSEFISLVRLAKLQNK